MKKTFLLIIFLFPFWGIAQELTSDDTKSTLQMKLDENQYSISKDIYRLIISTPLKDLSYYVPDIMVLGNYEHALYNNVSIVASAGIRMCNKSFGLYVPNPVSSYHFTGSAEIRYYYALQKREKKLRPTQNFTGGYLSISQYFLTNPFTIISKAENVSNKDAAPGQAIIYLNIGYQKQWKQFYFNCFAAPLQFYVTNKPIMKYDGSFPAGITIGYVFKNKQKRFSR
ncbi:MAG: hypothetical protein EO766_11400 [Hydrotalea sp. AMD]|uniref:hypothetical protein n=1 Tax=Hydrotalea sp. AMD TaxID=2501297 RepID=UPI000941D157|nr:hypothetical protein [Hydrotalea sp. AMD]RWZ87455.1 MAG: hypothetical protein EO766_11400 [Hydrotalea sp. AMD]